MKNTLLILLVGVILGIFIASEFGCDKTETKTVTTVKYVDREVKVEVEKIVYKSLPQSDTIIYKDRYVYDTIIGDTVYVPVPVNYTVYNENFIYKEGDSVSVEGTANIIAQDLHNFSINIFI